MFKICLFSALLGALGSAADDGPAPNLDFTKPEIPKGWTVTAAPWKVAGGVLQTEGGGTIETTAPWSGGFLFSFDVKSDEKANFELKLLSADGKDEQFTFAFLGKYHPALDGVKCAVLKHDQFVATNPRLWLFPGRVFHLEVRALRQGLQMFMNDELVAALPDDVTGDAHRFRIVYNPEGKRDKGEIGHIKITGRK